MRNMKVKKTDWSSYRPLRKGELIDANDEVYDDDEKSWKKTMCAGSLAPDPQFPAHRIYRRLV
jgi:hypothetical protein